MTSTILDSAATQSTGPRLSDIITSDTDDNSSSTDELDIQLNFDPSTRTKRLFGDHQTELDLGQPSKKRRKQSKPVRISALAGPAEKDSEDERDAEQDSKGEGKLGTTNENGASPPIVDELVKSMDETDNSGVHSHFGDANQGKVQYEKQKSETDAFLSIRSEIPIHSNFQKSDSTSPLDFVVGSWMSELQSKAEESLNGTKQHKVTPPATPGAQSPFNDRKLVLPSYLPLGPPPFLIPILSQGTVHNPSNQILQQISGHGTNPSQPSIRIFNPDAYCELCNKEFCNKYFLKTHKANKHGIYVDSPIQSAVNSTSMQGSPYAASFIAAAMTTPSSLILPRSTQPQVAKPSQAVSQPIGTENNMKGDGDSQAVCDICFQKFGNQLLLRQHKFKVHGVMGELFENVETIYTDNGRQKLDDDVEEDGELPKSESGSNPPEIPFNDLPEVDNTHLNVQNKTISLQTDINSRISSITPGVEFVLDSEHIKQDNEDFERHDLSTTLNSSHVKNDGSFSVDRLRRLGVINVDAFCEICCKEYCNKYFLRTHKMKRHGIIMNDCDSKEGRLLGSSCGSGNSQTSPLNLIVAEQGTNSSDSGGKIRTELPDGEEPECDVCGRKFQSIYLMQMHRAYLHGQDECHENSKEISEELNATSNEEQLTLEAARQYNNNNNNNNNNNISNDDDDDEENENVAKRNISADLQKLQTMISQLNSLNMVKGTSCNICNKTLENGYFLRAHMMSAHGILIEENTDVISEKPLTSEENSPPPPLSPSQTFCHICKKDYFAKFFLKQHMDEFHGSATPVSTTTTGSFDKVQVKEEYEARQTPDKIQSQIFSPVGSEKRVSLTPTSSYCEICNKELCNKYFMKTHMQRMHGIEIENGAQIGGVICDICNKELCSKYFLRVHKQNTHGIVEDASGREGSLPNTNGLSLSVLPPENDQALKVTEFTDLNNRYYTHFTEVCYFCNRRFRSPKWLKAHLLNDHGEAGIGKWKELEQRYQLQQPKLINIKTPVSSNHVQQSGSNHSPTLKIPHAWSSQDQSIETSENTGELPGQNVLSSLFGARESPGKSYHCSYCSFTTPVLAFLFVHERSHTGNSSQTIPDPSKPFQCPVCLQSFLQVDIFQHHIMTHQFSGLLNPFFPSNNTSSPQTPTSSTFPLAPTPNVSDLKSTNHSPNNSVLMVSTESHQDSDSEGVALVEKDVTSPGTKNKFRCSRCFQRFRTKELCQIHVKAKHSQKSNEPALPSAVDNDNCKLQSHGMNKCMWCDFSSSHTDVIKKHIRKEHRVGKSPQEVNTKEDSSESWMEMKVAITDDVKKKLQEAVRKCQLPASYAVPQKRSSNNGPFVMQPFIVEEPNASQTGRIQLVPSLVFLPVRERLSEPLTVSVTLTPT